MPPRLGFRSEAGLGLALAVPLLGASLEFAFFEPVFVYAAKGWALVVGARLKLVRRLGTFEDLFQFMSRHTRWHFVLSLCVW